MAINMDKRSASWARATKVLAGGNSMFSKHPDLYSPQNWPIYFDQAYGCRIVDQVGCEYIDFATMGVGANLLGYAHPEVNAAVAKSIHDGNSSSLNCFEDVLLAEKLIKMHPWFDKAKFARTGGEANAIAVRIARTSAKNDKIAVCGYHGWHDWYLAANLRRGGNLDSHLMPGLSPRGVPKALADSVTTFNYNDLNEFVRLVEIEKVGIVKMEVVRNIDPDPCFLAEVRRITKKNGVILIFDECTSGFRSSFGGIHQNYSIIPDLAIFGKALGNGYPITAVLGTRELMDEGSKSFISSTFWSERVGPVSALKTLEIMERDRSWETITNLGLRFTETLSTMCAERGFRLETCGIPSLLNFSIFLDDQLIDSRHLTEFFLRRKVLAKSAIYFSVSHTDDEVEQYFSIFADYLEYIRSHSDSSFAQLDNQTKKPFGRLN